jgi:hypothetical protein
VVDFLQASLVECGSDGAVAIPLDVAFSLRLVSVLRRQRAGLASAAAVMIGVKAIATMARVDPILTRSGHSSHYVIDIAWVRCFGPGQLAGW